jgi:galactonate dehydratase
MGAIAGIETALWDLAGKILNTPAYNLLGGKFRDKVKVYYDLAPADTPKTTNPKEWIACAQRAKNSGFVAMKVDVYRGGGDVPDWANILKAMRAEVGPDVQLGVDFHWRMTPEQTDKFIELIEPVKFLVYRRSNELPKIHEALPTHSCERKDSSGGARAADNQKRVS